MDRQQIYTILCKKKKYFKNYQIFRTTFCIELQFPNTSGTQNFNEFFVGYTNKCVWTCDFNEKENGLFPNL